MTVGIVGLGLIGGSFAKAYQEAGATVLAWNRSRSVLDFAIMSGAVDAELTEDNIAACDLVLIALYPEATIEWFRRMAPHIGAHPVVLDCGGTKRTICAACFPIAKEHGVTFLGGHPMAGSEKIGYSNAKIHLLENAYYILTPGEGTTEVMLETMIDIVKDIHAIPVTLNYREHDRITAAISHLPHIIAYTLVNLVKESDNPDGLMRMLAAGGFKDITRIASSSPEMWQQICTENKAQITDMLKLYICRMTEIGDAIQSDDLQGLLDTFASAKEYRDDIPKSHAKSLLAPSYEIFVDLVDESGAIATIATILATNNISIMNIGIVHNREFQEGVLHIEFYDNDSTEKAVELLNRFHYVIHLRK